MAINWTPARLEVDLNYKSKDIILASEWNNLWKETRLQGNNNTDGIVLLIEAVEGNIGHLTNLDNLFADLESKVTAHTGNSDIHVTSTQKTAWTAKYDKPSGGIPKSDLASAVQSSLEKADSALQQHQDISSLTAHVANNNIHVTTDNKAAWSAKYDKPAEGIPKTDLASGVQASLNKADTALQEHQDISDLITHVANSNIHVTSENKTAWSAKYDKPTSGIPKTDLASAVQTSLGKADTALQEHQDISALTSHVANNDIHVTTANKTAWDAKAEVFTITLSNDESGQPVLETAYEEIVSAYNNGKLLRVSPSALGGYIEGHLILYVQGTFVFAFPATTILLEISSTGAVYADAFMYLPSANTSDAGKVLKVDGSGNPAWTEASSSGTGGKSAYAYAVEGGYALTESDFTTDLGNLHNLPTHISNTNIHIDSAERTAWNAKYNKPSSGIPKTDLASTVQTSLAKADASPEVFLVSFTQAEGSMSFTSDKTYAEIVAAHQAGKIVRCSVSGDHFGQLVSINSTMETVIFSVEFISSFSYIAALTIDSADKVELNTFYFYTPTFLQKVISAAAWSDGVYSFESDFPNMLYDIEVELNSTATSEQLEAWSSAKPTAVFGTNTMKVLGDVPTVDIPVIVKVVFNAKSRSSSGQQ